jgi:S1-C subfamily serine protease
MGMSRSALASLSFLVAVGLAEAHDFSASVVRVHAVGADGTVKLGSGVVTGPGQVATACHVTRGAKTIEVEHGVTRSVADMQVGSQYHDLCLLTAQMVDVRVAPMRQSEDLKPGEHVIAVGFESGAQAVEMRGSVAALYPYDDGYVIRTTASFDFGSSGGGLFDQAGNLVGILAFKARTGENLRFALPTEWLLPATKVATAFALVTPTSMGSAFWERPQGDRPAFLGVARREAAGQAP